MGIPDTGPTSPLHQLIVDDAYQLLKNRFTREGKGRRPDATPPPLTNRVLVQLWDIMLGGGFEQKKVLEWLGYLYPDDPLMETSLDRIRCIMNRAYTRAGQLANGPPDVAIYFLDKYIEFNFVSDIFSGLDLDRDTLLGECSNYKKPLNFRITNEIVLELDKFQNSERLNSTFTAKWLHVLLNDSDTNDKRTLQNFSHKISKLKSQRKKLRSSKKSDQEDLKRLLNEEFLFSKQTNSEVSSKSNDCEILTTKVTEQSCVKCLELEDKLTVSGRLLAEEKEKVSLFKQQLNEYKDLKAKNDSLKNELKNMKRRLLRNESVITKNKCFLKISERKRKLDLSEKDKVIDQLEAELESKRRKVKKIGKIYKTVHQTNSRLNEKIFKEQTLQEVEIKSGENNAYSDNIRRAIILLQSEAGVSSQNASKVIRIIGKHIFDHEFSESLPTAQTCLNMNAEGLVISNIQVAEQMLASENVTLHLDGTSRDHQKVVNHQVTLDDGSSLYLGFTLVACEDSNTILDITISLLKRISEIYSEISKEHGDEIFLKLLRKIKNTMTDRAATMKSFDKKLEEFLKSEIGEDLELNFLHCNAHFLLGMSDASDKALKNIEDKIKKMTDEPIGRDKDAQFSRFFGENETCSNRLIRTLCDILGPRGDQKNGCKIEWKEFCPDSTIPSFKSNRFNCYFAAAAAIIHHYDRIKLFFTSGVLSERPNLKIQSVGEDIKDLNLMSCICALALFYLKVSGPYWKLVNSSATYSQFCHHVRTMHCKFVEWSSSDSDLLNSDFNGLFGYFSLQFKESPFSRSVHNFLGTCNLSIVQQSLQAISEACATVTLRQLGNFIDGSFDPEDEAMVIVLKNCPLTNLIGESSFGDLDYDIKKRANCSNLQRTASHCVKRNKTCSDFLDSKSKSDRVVMFSVARRQRQSLVKEAKSNKIEMSVKIREKMIENQQKKIEKESTAIEKNGALMRRLDLNGGVCKDSDELDKLLENLTSSRKSKKLITEIIKDQIRYHKLIRNVKDKELNMTGNLEGIILRLRTFLS